MLTEAITTGIYESNACFKRRVKEVVKKYEKDCFIASMLMYKHIPNVPLNTMSIKFWFWWKYCSRYPGNVRKCRVMARILYGETCLQADMARYRDTRCRSCQWCAGAVDDATHMLFQCDLLSDIRIALWRTVLETMPEAMVESVETLSPKSKLEFILTGCNGAGYNDELENTYSAMLNFVYNVYRTRQQVN